MCVCVCVCFKEQVLITQRFVHCTCLKNLSTYYHSGSKRHPQAHCLHSPRWQHHFRAHGRYLLFVKVFFSTKFSPLSSSSSHFFLVFLFFQTALLTTHSLHHSPYLVHRAMENAESHLQNAPVSLQQASCFRFFLAPFFFPKSFQIPFSHFFFQFHFFNFFPIHIFKG